MTSLPMNARSELVTPLNRASAGVFEMSRRLQASSAALSRMTRRGWLSIMAEWVLPARRPTRGSGLGGPAELLVIGDGALEDDIDVQAAKTDIAASDAATIGPAVRVREAGAMGGFSLRGRTYYKESNRPTSANVVP